MNAPTDISLAMIETFRALEVKDKFAFIFVSDIKPENMSMAWAYGDHKTWTKPTGIALLERVIAVANEALIIARSE